MKWPWRWYLIALLPILLSGCALLQSRHQQTPAEQLLTTYRIPALLAQAAPAVTQSLNRNLPATTPRATRDRLDQLLDQSFAPGKLRQDVLAGLAKRADSPEKQNDLKQTAHWLAQNPARHMINLEHTIGNPDFLQRFKQFKQKKTDAEYQRRLQLARGLIADQQRVELQSSFNTTLLEAMIRARNETLAPAKRVSEVKIQSILSATRQKLDQNLKKQLPRMLLYVYRGVGTTELSRYAAIQHRPAMVWANRAIVQSVQDALKKASRQIMQTYQEKD